MTDSPSNFVYSRDMGAKEASVATGNLFDAKIWGLKDNEQVFIGIRAYDLSGNKSAFSPLLRATPWPLAPIPNGSLPTDARVEVAIASALNPATLNAALTVRRVDGSPVQGTLAPITNLDGGQVIGLSFTPAAPLAAGQAFTAALKGGPAGIKAADGRSLPEDYTWSFNVSSPGLFLPLVAR